MNTNSAPLRAGGIAAAREYQELPAWQKAIAMAERVYRLSESFPARELTRELRAAAARVATHIAAGSAKPNEQGILNSYFDAQAATAELSTLATIAQRLGYLSAEDAASFAQEREAVTRLLIGMRHGLKVEAKDDKRNAREKSERDREFEQRRERYDRKPKRDYGDRPRREGSDRATGREERQYKPRGEYKPRSDKPYGDRKPRGEGGEYKPKRDYSDKPRGERKPYSGDRPRKPYRKD